jgi:hypothetical protein
LKDAEDHFATAKKADALVARYRRLKLIAHPNASQLADKQEMLDQAGFIILDLVTGFTNEGHAVAPDS